MSFACAGGERRFYVGSYARTAAEPGIRLFGFDSGTSKIRLVGESAGVLSPSFCALAGDRLYAASEAAQRGGLAVYDLDENGVPAIMGEALFPDAAGTCFVLAHPTGACVYGADYDSGSVCVCLLDEQGQLTGPKTLVQHEGHGAQRAQDDPNRDRQRAPHVHTLSFVPGTAMVAAVDLGLDLIVLYQTDGAGRIVDAVGPTVVSCWPDALMSQAASSEVQAASSTPPAVSARTRLAGSARALGEARAPVRSERCPSNGMAASEARFSVRPAALVEVPLYSGPRIIAYHSRAPVAALVCELGCEVVLFRIDRDGSRWRPFVRLDLLNGAPAVADPADSGRPPLAAHCAFSPDGRFLYASTRGTNMLSGFELDDDCTPHARFSCPCGGRTPRHFALSPDGAFLAVANQTSDEVAMFRRDASTGKLDQVACVSCAAPSCIVWEEAGRRVGWKGSSIS